jgi:hypothetical protein
MGCWNKTCGLSNLPIHDGELVMVFTLVQRNKISDFCYSTALYSPVLLPFYSHYNDYGAGENSSGVGLPLIIDALKANLVEMELGENQYHDIAVKRDEFNEDKYFQAIHEQRLKVPSHDGDRDVQFVMFHKRVVDHILENYVQQKYVSTGPDWKDYKYVDYTFADVLAELPPVIAALMETGKDDILRWRSMSVLERPEFKDNLAADYLRHNDSYRYSQLIRIEDLIRELAEQNADDLVADVIIDHLRAKFIDSFMMSARKVWIPGCHEGSQSSDDAPYRALMSAMTQVLDEDAAKYAEEYGDEDEQIEMEL